MEDHDGHILQSSETVNEEEVPISRVEAEGEAEEGEREREALEDEEKPTQ